MADIEKETYTKLFLGLSQITQDTGKANQFFKDAMAMELPWEGETITKPEVQRMAELYEKYANQKDE